MFSRLMFIFYYTNINIYLQQIWANGMGQWYNQIVMGQWYNQIDIGQWYNQIDMGQWYNQIDMGKWYNKMGMGSGTGKWLLANVQIN